MFMACGLRLEVRAVPGPGWGLGTAVTQELLVDQLTEHLEERDHI